MTLLSLPDVLGMLVLLGILLWFRRRSRDQRIDGWLVGLSLILSEMVLHVLRGGQPFTRGMQAVALDAYLLAAVSFCWAGSQDKPHSARTFPFFALPAFPLLLLTTLYGFEPRALLGSLAVTTASTLAGLVYLLWFAPQESGRRGRLVLLHLVTWLPMLSFSLGGDLHHALYWGLGCLYVFVALSFRCRLRANCIGGWVTSVSFLLWALCCLAWPSVEPSPMAASVVQQIWNIQKFFVVIGMLLLVLEDETERRAEEALHDALTGLPNRRLFDQRLSLAMKRSRRSGLSTAVFAIDLNGFKAINDSFGHSAGDAALIEVAARLTRKTRSGDTVARCGGDEFLLIVSDLVRDSSCNLIANSLRDAIHSATLSAGLHGNDVLWVSASVGWAVYPAEAGDEHSLCCLADQRMYAEKRTGTRFRVPERVRVRPAEMRAS